MQPFVPANFRITAKHRENPTQTYQVYADFTLELPLRGSGEKLIAIPVTAVKLDAVQAQQAKTFSVICSTSPIQTQTVPIYEVDPRSDAKVLEGLYNIINVANPRVYQSLWFTIPPIVGENLYNALAVFVMPESNLGKGLSFGILLSGQLRPQKTINPETMWGQTPALQAEKGILYTLSTPPHMPAIYPLEELTSSNPQFQGVTASIEASAFYLDPLTMQKATLASGGILDVSAEQIQADLAHLLNLQKFEPQSEQDLQKWQLLARELAQKQEIIHRMMRENDEKN